MQQLVELTRIHPQQRRRAIDHALLHHVPRDPHCRGGGALAGPGLQDVERASLDRELDVLHVAVVLLEPVHLLAQLPVGIGHQRVHLGQRLGRADASHDVLALRVHQELAVSLTLPGGRVAGETDAGGRVVAHVAEHHLHDVHGGAQVVGDVVLAAVGAGPRRVPRGEHRVDRPLQLRSGILRELLAGLLPEDLQELAHQRAQVVGRQVDVGVRAASHLHPPQRVLEQVGVDARHHVPEHLHEPSVGVVCEPLVAAGLGQPLHRLVVDAQVQDRVHHARHRDHGARPHRHQQRVVARTQPLADALLERRQVRAQLCVQAVRVAALVRQVGQARLGGDREAVRHRQADRGHLGKVGALAAEQPAHLGRPLREVVDVAAHPRESAPSSAARRRSSTSSAQRAAASSIASLVTSMTGQPSRLCRLAVVSSSS